MHALTATAAALTFIGVTPEAFTAHVQTVLTAQPTESQTVKGTISKIGEEQKSFTIKAEDDKEQTIKVDEKTRYLLNGEESTKDMVLRVGRKVTVMHKDGLASSVDAKTEG